MRSTNTIAGKTIAAALVTTMAVTGLTACGGKKDAEETKEETPVTATEDDQKESTDEQAPASTVETISAPADPSKGTFPYDYTLGKVGTVMTDDGSAPFVPDFNISGMLLKGNHHDGDLTGEYKTVGLQSDFFLNEWIEFYFDEATQAQMPPTWKIVCLPHHEMDEYKAMSGEHLTELANASYGFVLDVTNQPESVIDGKALFGSGYANLDSNTPGLWDILFMKDGKVAQYVVVNMSTEPVA